MLMVRRKRGRWVYCIHRKTGEVLSVQIKDVTPVGTDFQVTLAIQDEEFNFQVLKPGEESDPRYKHKLPKRPDER